MASDVNIISLLQNHTGLRLGLETKSLFRSNFRARMDLIDFSGRPIVNMLLVLFLIQVTFFKSYHSTLQIIFTIVLSVYFFYYYYIYLYDITRMFLHICHRPLHHHNRCPYCLHLLGRTYCTMVQSATERRFKTEFTLLIVLLAFFVSTIFNEGAYLA